MPGRRDSPGWWVTYAQNDVDGQSALALSKSLRITLTNHELCIVVGDGVSEDMRYLLEEAFTYTLDLPLSTQNGLSKFTKLNFSQEVLLTLYLWHCCTQKAVFINPRSLVMRNCDELFKYDGPFTAVESDDKTEEFEVSLFVFEPSRNALKDIISHAINDMDLSKLTTRRILNSYFGQCAHKNKSKIGQQYSFLIDSDFDMNTFSPDIAIVHFASESPWLLQENNIKKLPLSANNNHIFPTHDHDTTGNLVSAKPSKKSPKAPETIAIVGLSCRFPGADNENEFWDVLYEGRDETKTLPLQRYFTRPNNDDQQETPAGYLKCPIEEFDAKFFEISPREADFMDPQQRLLLEVSWESLENAGINPHKLDGSNTAVFVGLWAQEYAMHISKDSTDAKDFPHKYLGNALCASAARISHFLGLRGPSIAMEAGCASALEGIHYACESLHRRETDMAITCGVNIALSFSGELASLDSFLLASDGKCKTFDESANGFARGEACSVIILKRMSDAVRDGNKIIGVIRGSAINSDGSGSTLGTPNAVAQELVIRGALKKAGVSPSDISYVEAHGTGTPIGDPIEFHALNKVFAGERSQPLLVGSVKTNIGHTEGASGMAGLVKVLLCMKNRLIPKHLNFNTLNPNISIDKIPAIIPLENTEWIPCSKHGLVAGISSFGLSGTNVHVIMQEPESGPSKVQIKTYDLERTSHLLVISAKSEKALDDLKTKYISLLESDPAINLADVAYSANTGRAQFRHRLAVLGKDSEQILSCLHKGYYISGKVPFTKNRVAFLFTGQGSQYAGMAKVLYDTHPQFRTSFLKCDRLLKENHGLDLTKVLAYKNGPLPPNSTDLKLNGTTYSQPVIFCLGYCLAELWKSFGVQPEYVLGHSVGEFAAAVVAGVLTLEEGLKLVVERSKLISRLKEGRMMVLKTGEGTVRKLLADFEKQHSNWVDLAAVNSEEEVVVSGGVEAIELFEAFCHKSSVSTTQLAATHAFHSREMDQIIADYDKIACTIQKREPKITFVSGTSAKEMSVSDFGASYWISHLREPVNFAAAFGCLENHGCNIFVEIGAQPVLLAQAMRSVGPEISNICAWCPSIRRNEDNWVTLLTSLSKMYISGLDIDWVQFDKPFERNRLALPYYPFQREKFWYSKGGSQESDSMIINTKSIHPLVQRRVPTPVSDHSIYYSSISLDQLPYIRDHKVVDKIILPAAAYLEAILAAGNDLICGGTKTSVPLAVENCVVEAALLLNEEQSCQLQIILTSQTVDEELKYDVKIYRQTAFDPSGSDAGKWKKLVSASFLPYVSVDRSTVQNLDLENLKSNLTLKNTVDDIYTKIAETGISFGPLFKSIKRVWYNDTEFLVETTLPDQSEQYVCHPIILDAMIQSCVATLAVMEKVGLYLPMLIKKCMCLPNVMFTSQLYIHVFRQASNGGEIETAAVKLYNSDGQQLALIEGLELVRTTQAAFLKLLESGIIEYPGFYAEEFKVGLGQQSQRIDGNIFKQCVYSAVPECHTQLLEGAQADADYYQKLLPQLDLLCYRYVLRAFVQLGWNYKPGAIFSVPEFGKTVSVLSQYDKLLRRWFAILAEQGDLAQHGSVDDDYEVLTQLPGLEDVDCQISKLNGWFTNEFDCAEHRFAINCGEHLAALIQGKMSPYSILFPEHSNKIGAASVYRTRIIKALHQAFGLFNAVSLRYVSEQLKEAGQPVDFTFRILEVGGGSGSATEAFLEQMEGLGIQYEYTFTDISKIFLKLASDTYSSNKRVKYRILDIEKDPKTQGFSPHYFDCVIADQVLHATQNLNETIQNIRHLLVPGGQLLLTEILKPFRLMDISFGFMEGWWRFTDSDIRQTYPCVDLDTWCDLLTSNGFSTAESAKTEDEKVFGLIMAFADDSEHTLPAYVSPKMENVWLIFGESGDDFTDALLNEFKMAGRPCVTVTMGSDLSRLDLDTFSVNPKSPTDFKELFEGLKSEGAALDGIVYLWGMKPSLDDVIPDYEGVLSEMCGGLLHLIQALPVLALIVVTKGAQFIGDQVYKHPVSATLCGLMRSFNNEFCAQRGVIIDIDPTDSLRNSCKNVFHQLWQDEAEHHVVYRNNNKYIRRLVRAENYQTSIALPKSARYKLENPPSGSVSDFTLSIAGKAEVGQNEVEVNVMAAALNFKDLLLALKPEGFDEFSITENHGPIPKFAAELGMDFAGVVSGVGADVSVYKVGDRVSGLIPGGAIASHVVVSEKAICPIPGHASFVEASTLPVAHLTARYFLGKIGKLKAGDKVLIHTASGGVGLAAIQLAHEVGAEIFVTAGSHRKRNYLRSLNLKHVYNSRTLSFGQQILADTEGQGVDIVLNSITGPNVKETTLSACAQNARFLEMSKLNVWSEEEVKLLRPDVFYFIHHLNEISNADRNLFDEELNDKLLQKVWEGKYKPLPYVVFPVSRCHDAFRFLQSTKHIGKVVITMPTTRIENGLVEHKEELFNQYGSYLITGGLGGIGMEVAKWMGNSGAKYLILVGRKAPSQRAEGIIQALKASGVNVIVLQVDVSDVAQCETIFRRIEDSSLGFPPLKGIMHAAGVLSDQCFQKQNWESVWNVYKPKIQGTWNLHALSQNCVLDHFVLFSSIVGLLGGMGQCNHSSANTFLDGFARFRVEQGLPCCSVNWGAWSDVGAAAHIEFENSFGLRKFSPSQGILSLQRALLSQNTNTAVVDVSNWNVLSKTYNPGNYFEFVTLDQKVPVSSAELEAMIQAIKECDVEERLPKVKQFLEKIIRDTLRLPETELLDPDQEFREMGIDSLMAMELRSRMQSLLEGYDHRALSLQALQENRTINKLAGLLTDTINRGVGVKPMSEDELLELVKKDSVLPESIVDIGGSVPPSEFKTVLFTGATGHLGPYILRELQAERKDLVIYCLIRSKSNEDATERLENILDELDLSESISLDKIICIPGDISKTNLGIDAATYQELEQNVDAIVHCSVMANLALPYAVTDHGLNDMRANNVAGLVNILKFATTGKTKPVQFASSIYALSCIGTDATMPEEFPADDDFGVTLKTGYHLSKFVCEKLLKQTIERKIPVTVLRHHYLCGDSQTGLIPTAKNHMMMMMMTSEKIGLFPDIDLNVTAVAVDIAAKVSAQLFFNDGVQLGVYNVNNPKICRIIELGEVIRKRGFEYKVVPYNEWREAAFSSQSVDLAPLADIYIKDVFESDMFSQHALAKHGMNEGDARLFENSTKLKTYIPNIDDMMKHPSEMIELHMDYYEGMFGKGNMKAFFEAVGKK